MRTLTWSTILIVFCWVSIVSAETIKATFNSASDVPITTSNYTARGKIVDLALNFAPAPGSGLTVVDNANLPFINGTFDNLADGQSIALSYGGSNYHFVANYHGGTGNDLVLLWANTHVFAWGYNLCGQLGDKTTNLSVLPLAVNDSPGSALHNKTPVAIAGSDHWSLALCSDGTIACWGENCYGQLGDGTSIRRWLPTAVSRSTNSAIAGKRVVAVSAGQAHTLGLCSDGTVVSWGWNEYGQLGDGTTMNRSVPVAVNNGAGSALAGKKVVAIAAAALHNLALCSDGTLVAWGLNGDGQLGNGTTNRSLVPIMVNVTSSASALNGKTIAAIAAGGFMNLVLSNDGSLAAWGGNIWGGLGDGSYAARQLPVAVDTAQASSALFGKKPSHIAVGGDFCLAQCLNGSLVAWGGNAEVGQVGNGSRINHSSPVAVKMATDSALAGKTVISLATGGRHSIVLCSDGTLASWGWNTYGQLGDGTKTNRRTPVVVSSLMLLNGERFVGVAGGSLHTLALVAKP